jgi:rubrerythrin
VQNQPGNTRAGQSLRELRDERDIDQTLQNLLRALSLNLELRARYRVFEFEASQDGHPEIARLFHELREAESGQIAELMAGLHDRLGRMDLAVVAPRVD